MKTLQKEKNNFVSGFSVAAIKARNQWKKNLRTGERE